MRLVASVLFAILAIPVIGVAAPSTYDQIWGDEVEARLDALEAEVFGTTTTTTTTTTTSTSSSVSAIAGIGCSNTRQAVNGYLNESTEDNLVNAAEGGHTVSKWASLAGSWDKTNYGKNRPADGYDGAWINLCEKASNGLDPDDLDVVIAEVRRLEGNVPIWLSPHNFYTEETCSVTGGNQIPNDGAALADDVAASDPYVFRGPNLGPLDDSELATDDCHLSSLGRVLVGSQLVDAFG